MKIQSYTALTSNLEAMLYEGMVKIGYYEGQGVGIYYTEDLICQLLDTENNTSNIMQLLALFAIENQALWGKIIYTKENGRYKITVSSEGLRYVYQKNKDNHFLRDLIEVLKTPNTTIDMVLAVFHQYSSNVLCEKSNHDEFEYAVSFADKSIDAFIYCFTFDEMGQYYHRFTAFDYHNLI